MIKGLFLIVTLLLPLSMFAQLTQTIRGTLLIGIPNNLFLEHEYMYLEKVIHSNKSQI